MPGPFASHPTTGDRRRLGQRECVRGIHESLIGDLIRDGATGASGQVGEPYLLGAVRPEILFPAYVAGFNLAEAFYLATPALSWQTVIVGDPLLTPFSRQALTRAEIEGDIHAGTGLPGFFARRRIAESSALLRGVPERAIELSLQAEARLDRDDRTGRGARWKRRCGSHPR